MSLPKFRKYMDGTEKVTLSIEHFLTLTDIACAITQALGDAEPPKTWKEARNILRDELIICGEERIEYSFRDTCLEYGGKLNDEYEAQFKAVADLLEATFPDQKVSTEFYRKQS